jgi:hypothetical protein
MRRRRRRRRRRGRGMRGKKSDGLIDFSDLFYRCP